jgi:hypothetical protein
LGDILLPEGQTVGQLVEASVVRAVRKAGYRVLRVGDVEYDQAAQVHVDIDKFWAWFRPGFWTIALEFESEVRLSGGEGVLRDVVTAQGRAREEGLGATSDTWKAVMEKGMEDLTMNLRGALKRR